MYVSLYSLLNEGYLSNLDNFTIKVALSMSNEWSYLLKETTKVVDGVSSSYVTDYESNAFITIAPRRETKTDVLLMTPLASGRKEGKVQTSCH